MDRRKFLQTLTALGASTAVSAHALSKEFYPAVAPVAALQSSDIDCQFPTFGADAEFPRIGIIAVGGTGGAILNRLAGRLPHLDRAIAIDSNPFALHQVNAKHKILVGNGKRILVEPRTDRHLVRQVGQQITDAASGLDLVFILAGMGGATGTGIAPIVAETLSEMSILTVGTVITPFGFEGHRRSQNAWSGVLALGSRVTTVFPISNETIAQAAGENAILTSVLDQTHHSFEYLYRNITNAVSEIGLIGIDLEDVQTVLELGGYSALGYGSANGIDGTEIATWKAIASPLLGQDQLRSASGVLVAIQGSRHTIKMANVNKVLNIIKQHASPAALMFSASYNGMAEDFSVSVLATGLPQV